MGCVDIWLLFSVFLWYNKSMKIQKLCLIALLIAGCQADYIAPAYNTDVPETCIDSECQIIDVLTPNGNDLLLETERHAIHVTARPDTRYEYRVWAGDKDMSSVPDVIVHDGEIMILSVQE